MDAAGQALFAVVELLVADEPLLDVDVPLEDDSLDDDPSDDDPLEPAVSVEDPFLLAEPPEPDLPDVRLSVR